MATAVYNEVFERKEMKFRLSAAQRDAIQRALAGRMCVDSFGRTRILSLYMDTPRRDVIARSVEKPLYKEKVRVRSYGMPREDSCVFVELKKKFKGIVYKRRVGVSMAAARAWMCGMPYDQAVCSFPLSDKSLQDKALSARSMQIAREIDACIARNGGFATGGFAAGGFAAGGFAAGGFATGGFGLEPSMLIACDRTAWKPEPAMTVGNPQALPQADVPENLRITFDSALGYRDYAAAGAARLAGGSQAAHATDAVRGAHAMRAVDPWVQNDLPTVDLLPQDESIMEIKCSGALPLWLVAILSANRVYQTSFSKYGTAYEAVGC